ncbi:MAG TPA: MBL fold metallo-hydrolase [Clostridiales bacterium]|nr:MBL fold metallo-hydrolase [Clostridiales bacterium]
MLENIQVLYHSSIKINIEKVIYIDPFKIEDDSHDADIIFITHSHYDHYSEEDIKKIIKENTKIIVTSDLKEKAESITNSKNIIIVQPNEKYCVEGISFETIPAYNINKKFHPKQNNWVGYVIELNGLKYYIAGDTDITDENKKVKCDVAFVPVGGTYTMTSKEAADLVNIIKPKIAVPIHYGSVVGTKQDATDFVNLLDERIDGKILM